MVASAACAGASRKAEPAPESSVFYTVTAELALARHEPRVAALQYAAAAAVDPTLWPRAAAVASAGLQPSLTLSAAEHWIHSEPQSLEAQRAAAEAALSLHRVAVAASHYRFLLAHAAPPDAPEAEFARIEKGLRAADNVYGARQVADLLAKELPASAAVARLQGFTALRADDPAAAARSFAAVLARIPAAPPGGAGASADRAPNGDDAVAGSAGDAGDGQPAATMPAPDARAEVTQAWRRARVLAGDVEAPLAEAFEQVEQDASVANRFDYSLLLWTAHREALARVQLQGLSADAQARPDALRVLGLIELQSGNDAAAETQFNALLTTGTYLDDAFYFLGLLADRRGDLERALRAYSRVQSGENMLPALLRAATILHTHGAASQADELLDRLVGEEPGRVPEVLAAAAEIYAKGGDRERAFTVLERALAEYPDNVELHYALASQLEERGQIDAALRDLKDLLKTRPDDPAALNALGFTLADHSRDLARARALIEQALAAAPKSAAIRDSLGWVIYRQGHPQQALPYLTAAFADEPGGDIGAHLGEVLWQLDQHTEAERIWTAAHRLDADNHLLQSTRLRLHRDQRAGR
jgi:tetratricopeptide (TPR) repeat protein